MKITITSASGNLLSHKSFDSLTVMTEMGEITVLPNHEPLLSVIRPGVMKLSYTDKTKKFEEYVTGGGVLTISKDEVIAVIDSIDSVEDLNDFDSIEARKKEAKKIMDDYRLENPENIDTKRAMELEYEYLKYAAMQELVKNSSFASSNSRK